MRKDEAPKTELKMGWCSWWTWRHSKMPNTSGKAHLQNKTCYDLTLNRKADGLIVALTGNLERPLVGQTGTFLEPGSANLISFSVEILGHNFSLKQKSLKILQHQEVVILSELHPLKLRFLSFSFLSQWPISLRRISLHEVKISNAMQLQLQPCWSLKLFPCQGVWYKYLRNGSGKISSRYLRKLHGWN